MIDRLETKLTNGSGAAAVLGAAIGSLALGIFALAGDASHQFAVLFNVWTPTGPLSGVTDAAIFVWLAAWFLLSRLWGKREVNLVFVNAISIAMFAATLLITFPPIMDFLQGK
jgi:hypothetical protein